MLLCAIRSHPPFNTKNKARQRVYGSEPADTSKQTGNLINEVSVACRQLVFIVQELCESRGGRPGLSVLTSFLVSVDVKND